MASESIDDTKVSISRCTGFLDLPAEIRNNVYHLALQQDEPIVLSYDSNNHKKVLIGRSWTRSQASNKYITEVGLLRTCRQVHSEATPILYGSNQFGIACDLRTLHAFLGMIGNSRSLIRHVHAGEHLSNKALLRSTVSRLKVAKGLQKLTFEWLPSKKMTPATAAAQCRVFIQALHKARGGTVQATVDVVAVELERNRPDERCFPQLTQAYKIQTKQYEDELKGELRKLLE